VKVVVEKKVRGEEKKKLQRDGGGGEDPLGKAPVGQNQEA